jgi:hypothetical protein
MFGTRDCILDIQLDILMLGPGDSVRLSSPDLQRFD